MAQLNGTLGGTVVFTPEEIATFPQGPPGQDATGYPPESLIRHVNYSNGVDSNSGLTPALSFKTIQAAYNDLVTVAEANYTVAQGNWLGVGKIYLAPGDHDVGSGVDIDGWRPVEIYGTRSGLGGHQLGSSSSRIISSSASATYMIRVWHDDSVSRGCRFRDIAFRPNTTVNTAMAKLISLISCDYCEISNCSFDVADSTTTSSIIAICQEADPQAQDQMAGRFVDNWAARMQFYKASGGNLNRIVVDRNRCNYSHATLATIELQADFRGSSVSFNQLEGTSTQIKASDVDNCVFIHNCGESTTVINPFIDFVATAHGNLVIGGDVPCPASTGANGIYVRFNDPSMENTYIGRGSPEGRAGYKEAVIDNSWAASGNRVYPARRRVITALKTAAYDIVRKDRLTRCDSTAGPFTVRLPLGSHLNGDLFTIHNYGTVNNVTVGTQGGMSILGSATVTPGASITYVTDGGGGSWYQL